MANFIIYPKFFYKVCKSYKVSRLPCDIQPPVSPPTFFITKPLSISQPIYAFPQPQHHYPYPHHLLILYSGNYKLPAFSYTIQALS